MHATLSCTGGKGCTEIKLGGAAGTGSQVALRIVLAIVIAFAAGFVLGRIIGPFHLPTDPVEAGKP